MGWIKTKNHLTLLSLLTASAFASMLLDTGAVQKSITRMPSLLFLLIAPI